MAECSNNNGFRLGFATDTNIPKMMDGALMTPLSVVQIPDIELHTAFVQGSFSLRKL